jgi:hypothetical protein
MFVKINDDQITSPSGAACLDDLDVTLGTSRLPIIKHAVRQNFYWIYLTHKKIPGSYEPGTCIFSKKTILKGYCAFNQYGYFVVEHFYKTTLDSIAFRAFAFVFQDLQCSVL